MAKKDYILEMNNITKTFLGGKIVANDNVSVNFERGEVHALVGENGSGKSTSMNILFGLYKQDSGEIIFNGEKVNMYAAGAAKKHKIGMVHQHFHLVDDFTVLENILIGQESPEVDEEVVSKLEKKIEKLSKEFEAIQEKLTEEELSKLKEINKLVSSLRKETRKSEKLEKEIEDIKFLLKRDLKEKKTSSLEIKIEKKKEVLKEVKSLIKDLKSEISSINKGNVGKADQAAHNLRLVEDELKGTQLTTFGYLHKSRAKARFNTISNKYGIKLDPDAKIRHLSVGQRQMVEIVKVL